MKIKKIFIHTDYTSECILDTISLTIKRLTDNQEGEYKFKNIEVSDEIISIRWYNSSNNIFDEYIKFYKHQHIFWGQLLKIVIYLFLHHIHHQVLEQKKLFLFYLNLQNFHLNMIL